MTSTNSIICSTCGTQVEISEALFRRAEGELRIRWEAEAKERLERATVVAREEERKRAQDQLGQLRQLLKQSATQLEGMQRRELELQQRAAEIDQRKSDLEAELRLKLSELVNAQEERIKAEAAKQTQLEMIDLKNKIAEQTTRLQEANTAELEHRKRVRELENEKHEIDLTVQRKVDEERQRIEITARQMSAAEYELKLREKDQQNEKLRQAVEELKRKSEQGSVELQGEALELDLEEKLRGAFPQDVFNPVARGARGAGYGEKLERAGQAVGGHDVKYVPHVWRHPRYRRRLHQRDSFIGVGD